MAGEDKVDLRLAQKGEDITRVKHLVSFAAGTGDRHQVVMADKDAKVGRAGEPLLDPAVVLAPDLALVEVGLGGVDSDEHNIQAAEVEAQARVAGAEGVLEEQIADVPRIVVARAQALRGHSRGASSSFASGYWSG